MASSQRDQPFERATFRRVLVCSDGSDLSERALPHAVAIATAVGAPLTLLRVLESPTEDRAPADPLQWQIRRMEAKEYMDRLSARYFDSTVDVNSELIEGRAAEEICRWGADHTVDLTVVTTHGAGGHSPWALASTARKLLDRAPGSVLIVPATAQPSDRGAHYERILVPLDGSPQAETALPIASRIAAAHGSELVIAHVVPLPELTQIGPLATEDIELRDRLWRRNERVARAYLDRLRAHLAGGQTKVRVILLQGGEVATSLVNLVREQIDLVVLAAHGRNGHLNLPCGGVTSEMIARSSVPVLVARSRAVRAMRRIAPDLETTAMRVPRHASS